MSDETLKRMQEVKKLNEEPKERPITGEFIPGHTVLNPRNIAKIAGITGDCVVK